MLILRHKNITNKNIINILFNYKILFIIIIYIKMSDENNIYKINLGGFPSIIKIDTAIKKKREFTKEVIKINTNILANLDILNINNIIKKK